jgi:hypothetical protein
MPPVPDTPAAGRQPRAKSDQVAIRRVTAIMLLAAAVLDLTRCGLVVRTIKQAGAAAGLVSVGAAAAVSLWTAHGCQRHPLVGLGRLPHRHGVRTPSCNPASMPYAIPTPRLPPSASW